MISNTIHKGKVGSLTVSTTITSTDPLLTRVLTAHNRFSAEAGGEIRRLSTFTPIDSANDMSIAFSASKYAQYPAERKDQLAKDDNETKKPKSY